MSAQKPFSGADGPRSGHRKHGWQKGQSGNPSGRPSIAKAVEAATGKTTGEVTAEMFKLLYDAAHTLDPADRDQGASWRHATSTVLAYCAGKPRESVDVNVEHDLTPEQYADELRRIAIEQLRQMPRDEVIRLIESPAPDVTIQ